MNNSDDLRKMIANHWLTTALKADELNMLLQKTTNVSYRKRETIVKRGEFATHLVLLLEGYVKVEDDEVKNNFVIDILQGPNLIGIPLVLSYDKYKISIVSLTEAEVLFVPMDLFRRFLETNSRFAYEVIKYGNSSFVGPLLDKLKSASRNNIRGRLAKLILHFSVQTHKSKNFALLLSRFELAQMIGFSRENVIRMLTEFHNEGIINLTGKSMEVLDLPRLEELSKYS